MLTGFCGEILGMVADSGRTGKLRLTILLYQQCGIDKFIPFFRARLFISKPVKRLASFDIWTCNAPTLENFPPSRAGMLGCDCLESDVVEACTTNPFWLEPGKRAQRPQVDQDGPVVVEGREMADPEHAVGQPRGGSGTGPDRVPGHDGGRRPAATTLVSLLWLKFVIDWTSC